MGLRERIDELEKRNNITSDAKLLRLIYVKLGKNPDDSRNEAGNFSKVLKEEGNRKLSIEYAAALEDIFGVTLDYLLYGREPKKEFKNRGLEYTAFQDSLELYEALYNQTNSEGQKIFGNYDEYDKNLLDYIVKYHSLNGVKFFLQKELCVFQPYQNHFRFGGDFYLSPDKEIQNQLIKMIFEIDDFELFSKAFRIDLLKDHLDMDSIVYNDDFIKCCLDSTNIFGGLIKYVKIDLQLFNPTLASTTYTTREMYTCNPLINLMIKYAVMHENEYLNKIDTLLNNASNNNYHIVNHIKNEIGLDTLDDLKVLKNGMVVDYRCSLGIIATFDYPISPSLSEKTVSRLNELNLFAYQITLRPSYNWDGSLNGQWLREGNYMLRKSSNNEVEYEMLEKMKSIGFAGVPLLVETKNFVDKFEYIEGEAKSFSNLPEDYELALARYFKKFHTICKEKIGKIYCHNSLDYKSVIFDDFDEVKAIVDWRNCTIGNAEDDLIRVIVYWIGLRLTSYKPEREKRLEQIVSFLEEYSDSSQEKMNFGDKLIQYIQSRIENLNKADSNYDDKFCLFKQELIFAELYNEELNKF